MGNGAPVSRISAIKFITGKYWDLFVSATQSQFGGAIKKELWADQW